MDVSVPRKQCKTVFEVVYVPNANLPFVMSVFSVRLD